MWLRFSIIVFVFYMTNSYCGIIHNVHRLKLKQDNGKTRERRAEDGVSNSGRLEVSEDVPENHPLMRDPNAAAESLDSVPSIKEKRCPRENYLVGLRHNADLDPTVGASQPVDVRRRDLHSQVNKRICTGCINRCNRFPSACHLCTTLCTPEELAAITETPIPSSSSTTEGLVGSAIDNNNNEVDALDGTTGNDARLSLKNRISGNETPTPIPPSTTEGIVGSSIHNNNDVEALDGTTGNSAWLSLKNRISGNATPPPIPPSTSTTEDLVGSAIDNNNEVEALDGTRGNDASLSLKNRISGNETPTPISPSTTEGIVGSSIHNNNDVDALDGITRNGARVSLKNRINGNETPPPNPPSTSTTEGIVGSAIQNNIEVQALDGTTGNGERVSLKNRISGNETPTPIPPSTTEGIVGSSIHNNNDVDALDGITRNDARASLKYRISGNETPPPNPPSTSTTEGIVGSAIQNNIEVEALDGTTGNGERVSLKNRFNGNESPTPIPPSSTTQDIVGSAIHNNKEIEALDDKTGNDARVSLKNRDTETNKMKRIYTIATLKTGKLKEVICKLLGISDTSDIDTVVVWITTKSNRPPEFSQGYKKQVTPNTEKLTDQLNKELLEKREKKIQQGGKFLTNEEIEESIGKIFDDPQNDPKHPAKSHDTARASGNYIEEEDDILPPYPIDADSIDLNMPRVLNPGLIEDTPYFDLGEKPPKNFVGVPTETRIGQAEVEDSSQPDQNKPEPEEDSDGKIDAATSKEKESETVDNLMATDKSTDIKKSMQKPEDENIEVENEKKTDTDADENDTLGNSKLRKKKKNKGNMMQGGHQHYPLYHRANTETDEAITEIPQNVEDGESLENEKSTETDADENDMLGTSKLKAKIKNKGNKMQAGYQHHSPLYHRANAEADEAITGISQNTEDRQGFENEKKTETDADENDTISTSKQEMKMENKGNMQEGHQHHPPQHGIETDEAITGISQNMEDREGFENGKKTETDPDENDTLDTKQKTEMKDIDNRLQVSQQHYPPLLHRANTETDEGITGVSQNIEDRDDVETERKIETDAIENDMIDTSEQKPKMKNESYIMQIGRQHYPLNHRPNSDGGAIAEVSQNIEDGDDKPQPLFPSSSPRHEPIEFVNFDTNHAPKPVIANQAKRIFSVGNTGIKQSEESSQNSGHPFTKNSDSDITDDIVPQPGVPSTTKIVSPDIIGSSNGQDPSAEIYEPPVLAARAHGLNEKNQPSNVQQMQIQQPVGSRSSEDDGLIVSPNLQSDEVEKDTGSKFSSPEVEAPISEVQADDLESERQADLTDHRGQQRSNSETQLPAKIPPSMPVTNVDDFDKAAAALKDVERLVQTIQEATKIDSQNRLLGQEQPLVGMEQTPTSTTTTESDRIEIPQRIATETILSSPPQVTADTATAIESKGAPPHVIENIGETEHATENERRDDQSINEMPPSKLDDDRVSSQLLENVLWDTDRQHPSVKISHEELITSDPMENENSNVRDAGIKNSENTILGDQSSNQIHESINENNHMKDESVLDTSQDISDVEHRGEFSEEMNIPDVENRGEFSKGMNALQQSPFSNYLGKFGIDELHNKVNYNATTIPKDIYFIGNGIKLPLQMVQKNDGAVHLSVDLDKLCTCKNFSCPKNHTAIEETVGTILEKEAELKDQLAATNLDGTQSGDKQEESGHQNLEDMPLGITGPGINEETEIVSSNSDAEEAISTHRNERGIADSKWLEMKNSIAGQYATHANIFKRSVKQEELNTNPKLKIAHDKILSLFQNSIINNTANTHSKNEEKNIIDKQITTTAKSEILEQKSGANSKPITTSNASSQFSTHIPAISFDDKIPNHIKELINKKLTEVRSRMSDMERRNELNKQMLVSQEKLKNIFNTNGGQTVFDSIDTKDPKLTIDDIVDKTWEYILKQTPILDKVQSLNNDVNKNLLIPPSTLIYNSVMKDMLEKKNKGDETFDEVTPIKNSHQLKTFEEFEKKLDELNAYVSQYSKDGEKMIRKEARKLLKTHSDDVIKQEVEIVNNILTWLKNLTVDKK